MLFPMYLYTNIDIKQSENIFKAVSSHFIITIRHNLLSNVNLNMVTSLQANEFSPLWVSTCSLHQRLSFQEIFLNQNHKLRRKLCISKSDFNRVQLISQLLLAVQVPWVREWGIHTFWCFVGVVFLAHIHNIYLLNI